MGLLLASGSAMAQLAWVEDWSAQREQLAKSGVAYQLSYTGSFMSHLDGGFRRGTNGQGLLDFAVMVDLEKTVGWRGGTFHAQVIWTQGGSASSVDYIGNINEVSNIQPLEPTVRPYHVWVQQRLFDDKVRLTAGWMTLDTDFMISTPGNLFINSAYGPIQTWNINFGAPVYPLAALGFLAEWQVTKRYEVQAGVYDGNTGGEHGNQKSSNSRLGGDDGAAILGEVARTHSIAGCAGTLKLGAGWNTGLSMANATGMPVHGNGHAYVMLDQTLMPGISKDVPDWLTFFTRMGRVLHPGRSVVDFTVEGGFTGRGFRKADQWGVSATYSRFSRSFVQATRAGGGTTSSTETALELTYKAHITPWMVLQPTLQRIYHPQSGAPSATVLGLVMTLSF